MRDLGTVVRGIRTPIIKESDDLATIVVNSLLNASKNNNFEFRDKDVVAITEAVVGISEGNYVTVDEVAADIKNKFNNPEELGIVFPILSRNRFSLILKAIARSTKKLFVQLSFPSDEVGNGILDEEKLLNSVFNKSFVLYLVWISQFIISLVYFNISVGLFAKTNIASQPSFSISSL